MSDVLQGARTKDYVKEDINGIENSGDKLRYVTLQDVQGKRAAMDVLIHGVTVVSTGHAVEAGSARRLIKSTASGAKVGWFMRPTSGNSAGEEIPIIKIVDADTFVIAALFDMAISDTFELVKPVTPNYTASGDLNVVVNSSGPIQYKLNGTNTDVSQDTATPSNSHPLPANLFIQKNGQNLPVSKDTVTPSNTNPVPVEIVSGFGTEINITAGDIDIHTSSEGINFDSIRLGDGSGVYVGVTPSGEAKVFDANANTSLGQIATDTLSINLKTPALVGGKVPVDTGLAQPLTDAQLRATPVPVSGPLTDTQLRATPVPVSGSITANAGTNLNTSALSLEATQVAMSAKLPVSLGQKAASASISTVNSTEDAAAIGATNETAPATDTTTSGLNGRLQRVAQRLTSLIALFPTSIGQKTMAGSLSVTLASNQSTVVTNQVALVATYVQDLTVNSSSAVTLTAPAGAKWCKIMASDSNLVNIRVALGTLATANTGMQFQPGRSEDYKAVANISVIAETTATNQAVFVQWGN